MEYMLTQNQESNFFNTFEEAYLAITYPDAEIWKRIGNTDNFTKVWPQ